jgi:hypothetical protein
MNKKEGEHDYFFNMNGAPLSWERIVGAQAEALYLMVLVVFKTI